MDFWKKVVCVFFFSPLLLFADLTFTHSVDVISGGLTIEFEDHVVRGAVPIPIRRSYFERIQSDGSIPFKKIRDKMGFFCHTKLHVFRDLASTSGRSMIGRGHDTLYHVQMVEPGVGRIAFHMDEKRKKGVVTFSYQEEKLNQLSGRKYKQMPIDYRQNYKNNTISIDRNTKIATMTLANGGKRYYKEVNRFTHRRYFENPKEFIGSEYELFKEVSPSGHITRYTIEDNSLFIETLNPKEDKVFASVLIEYDAEEQRITATCSDGTVIIYRGTDNEKSPFLQSVEIEGFPIQKFEYVQSPYKGTLWLQKIYTGSKCSLEVDLNLPTIKKTKKGPELDYSCWNYRVIKLVENEVNSTTYEYFTDYTLEKDVNGATTRYYFNYLKGFERIEKLDKNGEVHSTKRFKWKEHLLENEAILNSKGDLKKRTHYRYDKKGRIACETKDTIEGSKYISYYYGENNLCIKEVHPKLRRSGPHGHYLLKTAPELVLQYTYKKGTDLLENKITGELKECYIYDEDHFLIEKRMISGDLETAEKYIHDPETKMIIEKDNGLEKCFYEYDENYHLIKESTEFGSTEYGYDACGRMIWKRFPLGAENEYEYDEFGNIIRVKEVGAAEKLITYNKLNLPILCEINNRVSLNIYDNKGRLVEEINYKKVRTTYVYDEFDNCIKKILPKVQVDGMEVAPCWLYAYDILGNIIKEVSPSGITTKKMYDYDNNIRSIWYPDGTKEWHTYDRDNNIVRSILRDKSIVDFGYDKYGRCIWKKQGELEERWEYDGVLLQSYTDQRGLQTFYSYDVFGRKVAEECGDRRREFEYDEMGNLCRTIQGDLVVEEVFDIEGRVIETSENGFHQIRYEYNAEGQKAKAIKLTSQGEAEDLFFYDNESNLTKHISPAGDESFYIFDNWTRTEIDPLGNKMVETFDRQDRLIKTEKLSPEDETYFLQEIYYDIDGNVVKKITKDHVVEFEYDVMGQLIYQIESGKKETSFEYDQKGRLIKETKPSGVSFEYEYDQHDLVIAKRSNNRSIDYEYVYAGLDLLEIKDNSLGLSIQRTYNKFGEVIEESGLTGFTTKWYYDTYGRKKEMELCDGSSIHYEYDKSCMIAVLRKNARGEIVYAHRYTKFDVNQHVAEELLPMGLGKAISTRDILELPTSLSSPFHRIRLEFNGNHLVTNMYNSLTGDKEFDYDALSQLKKENEEEYAFDALGNSKEFEVNQLNQILGDNFGYDPNGNLLRKDQTKYVYDALDRLVSMEKEDGQKIHFTYDPLSRLVKKTIAEEEETFYLYDDQAEIGCVTKEGEIIELKVLGLGIQGDIGAAIAIELQGEIFVPLHDLQGNVLAIIDYDGHEVECYPMNAFGEEKARHFLNPWRFSSKREIHGLIYFGMRFYDPALKRWLTPDPAGFADSQNLYQFNLNSPINRLDQFGLRSEHTFQTPKVAPVVEESIRDLDRYMRPTVPTRVVFFGPKEFEDKINENPFDLVTSMEHAAKLSQNCINQIAFITYQNGINNYYEDFINMGEFLHRCFPETIIIGVYNDSTLDYFQNHEKNHRINTFLDFCNNPTSYLNRKYGGDMVRACTSANGNYIPDSAHRTAHLFMTVIDALEKYAPDAKWLHSSHSEAAMVANIALRQMPKSYRIKTQEMCYSQTFGGAQLHNKNHFINAWCVYSKGDKLTGRVRNNATNDHNVIELDSRETSWLSLDHSFQGATYGHYVEKKLRQKCSDDMGGIYAHTTR
ncbi:RHS repeat-associated core domain-containing protein [bacterium]|nr:RHS repeat-associated core domain-containing protein [bacterium]